MWAFIFPGDFITIDRSRFNFAQNYGIFTGLKMKTKNFTISLKKLHFICGIVVLAAFFWSCDNTGAIENEVNAISVNLELDRFDIKFYEGSTKDIPALKTQYPYLFPAQFSDSVWVRRQTDSLQLLLKSAVEKTFPSVTGLEKELSHLFQHVQYHFSEQQPPHAISIINNVDYQSKSIYADSLLLISLDTYLGVNHPLYEGIPTYIRQEMDKRYMLPHIAEKIALQLLPPPASRSFLAQMVYYGKIELLKQYFLPHLTPAQRLGYTEAQYQWAEENERYMWQYLIEKQLLFDTDPDLQRRFIAPAPFSKFYLEIDNESPGKIGRWIGAQIVSSYWEQNNASLETVLNTPAQQLFNRSNYKPKR